jgi:hypothetical protein
VASVESACGAYVSCYEGCECSDLTCLQGCLAKIDSTCESADSPLETCIMQSCSSQCNGSTTTGTDGG